jgi:hypothetical protein
VSLATRDAVRGVPRPVRLLNAVGRRAGDRGPLGPLDADDMLRDARRRTGLSDLGPDTGDALGRLVDAVNAEARLTALGRLIVNRMLRTFVAQRLRIVAEHRRSPALAATPVVRPIFVVGYWRTGTTLLHNLLAQGDGARPLYMHEAVDPIPPALRGSARDTRPLQFGLQQRGLYYLSPEITRIHDFSGGPAECLRLLGRSFVSHLFPHMVPAPSYEDWLWGLDDAAFAPVYALHRMQLQTLQADGRPGHWVLKSPAHLPTLGALLAAYPDATVVQTHRDPAKVLGSLSSLVSVGVGLLADAPDPRTIGRQVLARTERTLAVVDRTRAALGDRVVDVRYADLVRDPVGVAAGVQERAGRPLSAAGESRMRAWLAANPQGKHGAHHYSLAQFGLDPAAVERFAGPYRERHGIPAETAAPAGAPPGTQV